MNKDNLIDIETWKAKGKPLGIGRHDSWSDVSIGRNKAGQTNIKLSKRVLSRLQVGYGSKLTVIPTMNGNDLEMAILKTGDDLQEIKKPSSSSSSGYIRISKSNSGVIPCMRATTAKIVQEADNGIVVKVNDAVCSEDGLDADLMRELNSI